MTYRMERIELYVRETRPGRIPFALGREGGSGDVRTGLINPLGHVRMELSDSSGRRSFGCSGDRLSVRWLDKRPGRSEGRKLRELVSLMEQARDIYLDEKAFESPFVKWLTCHQQIMDAGKEMDQEDLTSSFASAQMESAMLDAVCRLERQPIFDMLQRDRLGIRLERVHPQLKGLQLSQILPARPREKLAIRHTIGLADPLTEEDLPVQQRADDGLPETLEEYIRTEGIRYFKVKISGDPQRDLERLERIWEVVLQAQQPVLTLDANESYEDLEIFAQFVELLQDRLIGLFQHVEYIEEPLPRHLALDEEVEPWIRKIGERKPLIIDESDGRLDSFRKALDLGYQGTSHKNCKGFIKSLLNYGLVFHHALEGRVVFLSGEDLQNLPVVPLHQDTAAAGILNLAHCERNGHHYNYGLSMLSEKDKRNVVASHPDLYVRRGDEWFLKIQRGMIEFPSLYGCAGFAVCDEPDWDSMTDMRAWVEERHPAEP